MVLHSTAHGPHHASEYFTGLHRAAEYSRVLHSTSESFIVPQSPSEYFGLPHPTSECLYCIVLQSPSSYLTILQSPSACPHPTSEYLTIPLPPPRPLPNVFLFLLLRGAVALLYRWPGHVGSLNSNRSQCVPMCFCIATPASVCTPQAMRAPPTRSSKP